MKLLKLRGLEIAMADLFSHTCTSANLIYIFICANIATEG